jgi:hypothetical protein
MLLLQILFISFCLLFQNCSSLYQAVRECDEADVEASVGDFKCYNGGRCIEIELNATRTMQICQCRPGYTGRQCEQISEPCSPDPCLPNGYCNSNVYPTNSKVAGAYVCQCKPGYTGPTCQENINDCLNAKCENDGLCIDGINSYECECKWPYIGRYCETKMKCTDGEGDYSLCKNDGHCYEDADIDEPVCVCRQGFTGKDCSQRVDQCSKLRPCQHGSVCVNLDDDYECRCLHGYTGKNCELIDHCEVEKPCHNNATCINIITRRNDVNKSAPRYSCNCAKEFTGINCDVKIECQGTEIKILALFLFKLFRY